MNTLKGKFRAIDSISLFVVFLFSIAGCYDPVGNAPKARKSKETKLWSNELTVLGKWLMVIGNSRGQLANMTGDIHQIIIQLLACKMDIVHLLKDQSLPARRSAKTAPAILKG